MVIRANSTFSSSIDPDASVLTLRETTFDHLLDASPAKSIQGLNERLRKQSLAAPYLLKAKAHMHRCEPTTLLVGRVFRSLSSKSYKSITVKYRGYSRKQHILFSYRSRCVGNDTARGDFRSFTWRVTSEKHSRTKWAVTKAIFTCPVLAEVQSFHAPLRANDSCS